MRAARLLLSDAGTAAALLAPKRQEVPHGDLHFALLAAAHLPPQLLRMPLMVASSPCCSGPWAHGSCETNWAGLIIWLAEQGWLILPSACAAQDPCSRRGWRTEGPCSSGRAGVGPRMVEEAHDSFFYMYCRSASAVLGLTTSKRHTVEAHNSQPAQSAVGRAIRVGTSCCLCCHCSLLTVCRLP